MMDGILPQIFVYFTIIQSLLLALHFYTMKKGENTKARILSSLLFVYSLTIIVFRLLQEPTPSNFVYNRIFFSVRIDLSCSVFFLLYCYIKVLLTGNLLKKRTLPYHLLPFFLIFALTFFTINSPSNYISSDYWGWHFVSFLTVLYYTIYLILIWREICLSSNNCRSIPNFPWLMVLLGSFLILWISEVIVFVFSFTELIFALIQPLAVIYTIVPFLFVNTILMLALKKPKWLLSTSTPFLNGNKQTTDMKTLINDVIWLLSDQEMFKDSELDLNKLSDKLNRHPRIVSLAINEKEKMTFSELVNKYRIEEAKKQLIFCPEKTIQEVMFDVGYNSKSAFNHHFKKLTGCTPSKWKNFNKK